MIGMTLFDDSEIRLSLGEMVEKKEKAYGRKTKKNT